MNIRARLCLRIYAALGLIGSALHVWWHWVLPSLPQMRDLTQTQWRVINVMNLSIAGFCMLLGSVGFWLSRGENSTGPAARPAIAGMVVIWLWRLLLEWQYPIDVPLLGQHTSAILQIMLVTALGLLILAWPKRGPAN